MDSNVMNSIKDLIKSLESEVQFLRKEIKEKNTLILSLIPLKILESKYCKANNLQNTNNRTSCLQERGRESTASGNALGKNFKEVFVEKMKITDNVQTASPSHSTKQGDSNSNITKRVKKMGESISTNNRGHEDKKNVIILGDSVIKNVSGYDIAGKLNRCKVFVISFSGAI